MRRLRFSLAASLLLTAALAALLGANNWRRARMQHQVDALQAMDVDVKLPVGWIDSIWQRPPAKAYSAIYAPEVADRCDELGVKTYDYWIVY
ncbi:MAG TPA: hypothetical protein VF175_12715 [Lacipirellula sp.]